jgi:hypothetical protein
MLHGWWHEDVFLPWRGLYSKSLSNLDVRKQTNMLLISQGYSVYLISRRITLLERERERGFALSVPWQPSLGVFASYCLGFTAWNIWNSRTFSLWKDVQFLQRKPLLLILPKMISYLTTYLVRPTNTATLHLFLPYNLILAILLYFRLTYFRTKSNRRYLDLAKIK